jgi:hypothetical protein
LKAARTKTNDNKKELIEVLIDMIEKDKKISVIEPNEKFEDLVKIIKNPLNDLKLKSKQLKLIKRT